MDLGSLLLATVVGAVFGGIGGYIGHLIGKRYPKRAKVIGQVAVGAGVLFAVAITPAIQAWSAGTFFRGQVAEEIDAELQKQSLLFKVIKDGWPSEYQAAVNELASLSRDNPEAGRQAGFEFVSELRITNAQHAVYAGDGSLRKFFKEHLALLDKVRATDGEDVCSALVASGAPALDGREQPYVDYLDANGAATMKALQDGRDRRGNGDSAIERPSEAELEAFDAFLVERTGEQGLLLRLLSGESKTMCSDGVNVVAGLVDFAPGQQAGRALRAATLYRIVAS